MTERPTAHIHDAKLDAVEELVEELCGAPLLVSYYFNHELARLQARFPDAPYIGSGVSGKELKEIIDAWNNGDIRVLLAHPDSAGHGLNLQGGGAGHVCWFGPIWNLELYDQFISRIHRQGNTARRVVNHIIVARGTIDELVIDALRDKSTTQDGLLARLNAEILRDAESPAAGHAAAPKLEPKMIQKMSRQSDVQAAAAAPAKITPSRWGKPAAAQDGAPTPNAIAEAEQMKAIEAKITRKKPVREVAPAAPEDYPTGTAMKANREKAMVESVAEVEKALEPVRAAKLFSKDIYAKLEGAMNTNPYPADVPNSVGVVLFDDHAAPIKHALLSDGSSTTAEDVVAFNESSAFDNSFLRARAVELALSHCALHSLAEDAPDIADTLAAARKIYEFLVAGN